MDMIVQIRWLIRRDMAEVLKIENDSFEFAWTEEDFLTNLPEFRPFCGVSACSCR